MTLKGKPEPGARLLPEGNTWLLVEFGADSAQEVADRAKRAMERVARSGGPQTGMRVLVDRAEQKDVWRIREDSIVAALTAAGLGLSRSRRRRAA